MTSTHRIPEGATQYYDDDEVRELVTKWETKHADMRVVETWEMSPSPTFDNDDSIVALFARATDDPAQYDYNGWQYPDFVWVVWNKDKGS